MPKNIYYPAIEKTLSCSRINSYDKFFTDHTVQEIYGVYLWNMAVSSAIYPLIQSAEIALRNAINNVAVEKYGEYWHKHIAHSKKSPTENHPKYNQLVRAFKSAKRTVIQEENKRRKSRGLAEHPATYLPDFNKVISETTFSTWECALHTCFYNMDKKFLWPKQSKKAFKHWPVQSSKDTHIHIYDLVSEIRPFRNRLSHHEPLWKKVDVKTEMDAIRYINEKIDKIEGLLNVIQPEKRKYLELQRVLKNARSLASIPTLDRYRYRSKSVYLSLKHKNKVKRFLCDVYDKDESVVFIYGGRQYQIKPA